MKPLLAGRGGEGRGGKEEREEKEKEKESSNLGVWRRIRVVLLVEDFEDETLMSGYVEV